MQKLHNKELCTALALRKFSPGFTMLSATTASAKATKIVANVCCILSQEGRLVTAMPANIHDRNLCCTRDRMAGTKYRLLKKEWPGLGPSVRDMAVAGNRLTRPQYGGFKGLVSPLGDRAHT